MRTNAVLVVEPAVDEAFEPHLPAVFRLLLERRAALDKALGRMLEEPRELTAAAALLVERLGAGGTVLVAGNGGSAAEAQHFAAELVGRFKREREPYAVLALTADSATLTAVANDYGFGEVFARQVLAFGKPGDVLVGFSTSGESENVVRAAEAGREIGMSVVAVTGARPNRLAAVADLAIRVPVEATPVVQELHSLVTHVLCDVVEAELMARPPVRGAVARSVAR